MLTLSLNYLDLLVDIESFLLIVFISLDGLHFEPVINYH